MQIQNKHAEDYNDKPNRKIVQMENRYRYPIRRWFQPVAVPRRLPRARFPCGCCSAFAILGEAESPAFLFSPCGARDGVMEDAEGVDAVAGVDAVGVEAEACDCVCGTALLCFGVPSRFVGPFCCVGVAGGCWSWLVEGSWGPGYSVEEVDAGMPLMWSNIPGTPDGFVPFCSVMPLTPLLPDWARSSRCCFAHCFSASVHPGSSVAYLRRDGSMTLPFGPRCFAALNVMSSVICVTLSASLNAGTVSIKAKNLKQELSRTSRHRIVACGIPNALTGSAGIDACSITYRGSSKRRSSSGWGCIAPLGSTPPGIWGESGTRVPTIASRVSSLS